MAEFKGNKNGITKRTNKTNTAKHARNSPSSVAQTKRKKIHTIHTYLLSKRKTTPSLISPHPAHIFTICNNAIHKI
jgi:hypothetical protein